MKIIDISQPVFGCKVYDGDTVPSAQIKKDYCDGYRLTDIVMCLHNGTHMDAPSHFLSNGCDISSVDLDRCFGSCTVTTLSDAQSMQQFCNTKRLIIKNGQLDIAAAQTLTRGQTKIIGVDSQSVGQDSCIVQVHQILAKAGIAVLEGLVLDNVPCGDYTLAAFPINFNGCEAAPVRAVLIKNDNTLS